MPFFDGESDRSHAADRYLFDILKYPSITASIVLPHLNSPAIFKTQIHIIMAMSTLSATGIPSAVSSRVPSWKRILDITCILLSMPLWLPVVLFLTLWIKLASPGPVFFRQERVGHRGRRFMIWKFR